VVKIKANIKLYKGSRKSPFQSGYRPMFNFIDEMKTSGKIDLIDKDEFCPGEEGEVNITFINKKYLGDDFDIGKKFTFGEGEITEIE
jgi:GTPase